MDKTIDQSVDGSSTPYIPSGKGKRIIILQAGTTCEGLIEGCDPVFAANFEDGYYYIEMKACIFMDWTGLICINN